MPPMNWSNLVVELEKAGWSLTALGQAIGLSPQAVSDIKQGRTKAPSGMAAVRLHQIRENGELPPTQERRGASNAA